METCEIYSVTRDVHAAREWLRTLGFDAFDFERFREVMVPEEYRDALDELEHFQARHDRYEAMYSDITCAAREWLNDLEDVIASFKMSEKLRDTLRAVVSDMENYI